MATDTSQHKPPTDSGSRIEGSFSQEPMRDFLKYSIATLLFGGVAAIVALHLIAPDQTMRTAAPLLVILIALTGWIFLSRGKIRNTKNVLALGVWVAVTLTAVFTGGVQAPVIVGYPILILTAAWLISTRAALALAGATIAVTVGLVLAQSSGLLPRSLPSSSLMFAGDQSIIYVVMTVLAVYLVRTYERQVDQLSKVGRDLEHRSHDLEVSKSELNRAQAVAKVGSWVYDITNDSMRLSAESCHILNLPEGTHYHYATYMDRVHVDDKADLNRAWQAALTGAEFDNEHRFRVHDDFHWIRLTAELSFGADGTALSAVGIAHDVTERKQAERALMARDERFQLLFDRASDGILILLLDGTILAVNESFARMHGYAPQEMRNLRLIDLDTPETARGLPQRMRRILAGESMTFEVDHVHKDGHTVPLEVTSSLIVSGGESLIQAFHRDISERRQAQEAQRIAATAFESQQGMMITDAKQVIQRINQAFAEITGYGAEEAVGQTPHLLSSGRHDAAFFSDMRQSLQHKGGWQGEIWNRRKSGEVYPEWLNISAVKDDAGQVSHYVGIFSDISKLKTAESKINSLAFYDPLTNLPNRRLLMDRLTQALTSSNRHQHNSALLVIDLDDFKILNETLGHLQGDVLLTQVAQRLVTCLREGDTAARLGSDEFAVMLEDLGKNEREAATQTRTICEKILATLNHEYQLGHGRHRSTSSIGITLFGGGQQENSEEPLKRAELAMYQAKSAGRNTMRFFDPQMQVEVTTRAALEMDLREAILSQQFVLNYQAQVVGVDRITGVEVLLRWQHPQRGLVSPAEFIALAEETGLILPIGHWVLETACTQLALWATQPRLAQLTLAVNVSALQFRQQDFVQQVLTVIAQTGANPKRLKLELTESMLVHDIEGVITKMSLLKAKGVSFSLDDFGTGYSSLSYLKRLPLDQLKIDQGFVRNIVSDPNEAAIAKMIVALADSLGLSVIAEGVEIQAQRDFLAGLGCHAYQGFLFSRPVPVQEFEALVPPD